MKINNLIKITVGKHHGWYETDQGFNVRKPLVAHYVDSRSEEERKEDSKITSETTTSKQPDKSRSWWQRFKEWFKNFINSVLK